MKAIGVFAVAGALAWATWPGGALVVVGIVIWLWRRT